MAAAAAATQVATAEEEGKEKKERKKERKKKKEVRDSRRVRLALRTTRSLGGSLDVIVLVALAHPMVPKRTNKREVGLSEW